MSETQGQGGVVATGERGAAPFGVDAPYVGQPYRYMAIEVPDVEQPVPCLCCENPPQIRSNPTDAIKDAMLYGTGMWRS